MNKKLKNGFAMFDMLIGLIVVTVGTVAFMSLQIITTKRNYDIYMQTQSVMLLSVIIENARLIGSLHYSINTPLLVGPIMPSPASNDVCGDAYGKASCDDNNAFIDQQKYIIQSSINDVFPSDLFSDRFLVCVLYRPDDVANQIFDGSNYRFIAIWLSANNKVNKLSAADCPQKNASDASIKSFSSKIILDGTDVIIDTYNETDPLTYENLSESVLVDSHGNSLVNYIQITTRI